MSQQKAECHELSDCINRQITHLLKALVFMEKNRMARAVKETMIWHGSAQQKKRLNCRKSSESG